MNMHTIQLKINDSDFEANRAYLQKEYAEIVTGKAEFYTQEELETELDKVIAKYEDKEK